MGDNEEATYVEKRGETGRSWVRKSRQEDVSCSIHFGCDSDLAPLPFTQ